MHMSSPDAVPCVRRSIFLYGVMKMLLIDFALVVILRVVDFYQEALPPGCTRVWSKVGRLRLLNEYH